jgi:N-acetyl-gamma-glutamyl-phosphate reductase
MTRIAVVGATGYTGAELLKWLLRHPRVRVNHVTSVSSAGKPLSDVLPFFRNKYDLLLEKPDPKRLAADTDLAFFALPHGEGARAIAAYLRGGGKAIDVSADFRLKKVKEYETWYKTRHPAPELLKEAVYGLPELFRARIRSTRIVANPGCYATTSILALAPLLRSRLVRPDSIVVDAKSGVSGAGKKLALMYHYSEVTENFQAYAVANHRHVPEIEQALASVTGRSVRLTFVPHLVPMDRGILVAAYATLNRRASLSRLRSLYQETYGGEPFLRILPEGEWPQTKNVVHTNFCDINVQLDGRTGRVVVLAALDNLVKGAAGQAIQNMNLLFGWKETEGLL